MCIEVAKELFSRNIFQVRVNLISVISTLCSMDISLDSPTFISRKIWMTNFYTVKLCMVVISRNFSVGKIYLISGEKRVTFTLAKKKKMALILNLVFFFFFAMKKGY